MGFTYIRNRDGSWSRRVDWRGSEWGQAVAWAILLLGCFGVAMWVMP